MEAGIIMLGDTRKEGSGGQIQHLESNKQCERIRKWDEGGDGSVTGANTINTPCSCLKTHNESHYFVELYAIVRKRLKIMNKPVNLKNKSR